MSRSQSGSTESVLTPPRRLHESNGCTPVNDCRLIYQRRLSLVTRLTRNHTLPRDPPTGHIHLWEVFDDCLSSRGLQLGS